MIEGRCKTITNFKLFDIKSKFITVYHFDNAVFLRKLLGFLISQ